MSEFSIIENEWITLPDGRRLSARIWLPADSETNAVPAILEYLPYRKRDGTAPRDESTYPSFARAGYAGVRVDIAGTGESEGEWDDEYSQQEMDDGLAVIEWISQQSWCNGKLGMMGISWGGFNGLQIAALQPEALKAVIAIGTTVDRYNDDIHYKNGCLLYSNFSWASVMLCFASRPPDPELVGEQWKDMWINRLNTQPYALETWLQHQTRNDYWKYGSVGEDFSKIQIPSLVISGWADAYINAPPACAEHLPNNSKAINGPWIHKYPHFALPHPRMDFLNEAIQWWDHWLQDKNNGVEELPAYRAYISENVKPALRREHEQGRWIKEDRLPSPQITGQQLYLSKNNRLLDKPDELSEVRFSSPLDCGTACGEVFTLKPDAEMAGDQHLDDAQSLTFDTAEIDEAIEILGRPLLRLNIAIDKPVGNIIVRLNDVRPDGVVFRVSLGTLNLTHRNSNEFPENMKPGQFETVQIALDECGYRFLPGHKVRVSISTNYWPLVMPAPEIVEACLKLGPDASISIPVRSGGDMHQMAVPEDQNPLPEYETHSEPEVRRWIEKDIQNGETRYHVIDDTGEDEMPGHGLRIRQHHQECWKIKSDDPTSYCSTSVYTCWMNRADWSIKTVSESELRCDAENFYISASVTAYQAEEEVNRREWNKTIKRNFI